MLGFGSLAAAPLAGFIGDLAYGFIPASVVSGAVSIGAPVANEINLVAPSDVLAGNPVISTVTYGFGGGYVNVDIGGVAVADVGESQNQMDVI